jgi:hypothetical protein
MLSTLPSKSKNEEASLDPTSTVNICSFYVLSKPNIKNKLPKCLYLLLHHCSLLSLFQTGSCCRIDYPTIQKSISPVAPTPHISYYPSSNLPVSRGPRHCTQPSSF